MILPELLAYRDKCLIHGLPLKPHCYGGIERKEDVYLYEYKQGEEIVRGLSLQTHHRQDIYGKPSLTGLNFKYDGSFYRTDVCPKWVIENTISVSMVCDICNEHPVTKERNLGYTTVMQIKENQYSYSFILSGSARKKTYRGELTHEVLKYTRDGKFYHVDTYLQTGHATVRMGTCESTDTLDMMLKGFMNLSIPSLTKMESVDQIVEKIKLYTLFS